MGKTAIGIMAIVVILLGIGFATGTIQTFFLAITGQGEPIFCNTYNFRCCNEVKTTAETSYIIYGSLWSPAIWQCPSTSTKCEVYVPSISGAGMPQCQYPHPWDIDGATKQCDNWMRLDPNSIVKAVTNLQITYRIYQERLDECGSSGCTVGVPVIGVSGCTFVTDKRVYDANGQLIKDPGDSQVSIAVPTGQCRQYTTDALRRVCGYTGETCDSNQECALQHPVQEGGYGIECIGTQKQYYGCLSTGAEPVCMEKDIVMGVEKCIEYSTPSRCGLHHSSTVQCCPGSGQCGTNAFCNPSTYTCTQTAECVYDYDCGTQQQCDRGTKTLRTPKCSAGSCTFTSVSVKCCDDYDCASGWYCDVGYDCKEMPATKIVCPYDCCEGETAYFDRPCPNTKPICCPNNACAKTQAECSGGSGTGTPENISWVWLWIPLLAGLGGLLGLGKDRDIVLGGVGTIIGGIAGYIIYWVLTNWLLMLILGILGMVGFAWLIWAGFGMIVLGIIGAGWRTAKGAGREAYRGARRR